VEEEFQATSRLLANNPVARFSVPHWWGGDVHFSHQVFLCRRDWETYSRRFPEVMDTDVGTYRDLLWPGDALVVCPTKAFMLQSPGPDGEVRPKSDTERMVDYVLAKTGLDITSAPSPDPNRGQDVYRERMGRILQNEYNQERFTGPVTGRTFRGLGDIVSVPLDELEKRVLADHQKLWQDYANQTNALRSGISNNALGSGISNNAQMPDWNPFRKKTKQDGKS